MSSKKTLMVVLAGLVAASGARASEKVALVPLARAWRVVLSSPSGGFQQREDQWRDSEESQDREQEKRDREQEKRDREEERKEREQEERDRIQEKLDRENELYDDGTEALDEARWQKALERFDQVAKSKGSHVDAAFYWKAYAENKLGRRADALATLTELKRAYPKSRWLEDAKALEVEVRQSTGQPVKPENQSDEELKLLAINALQQSDPEQAVPMLEKFLQGTGSLKLKQRALFVLAQAGTPEARNAMMRIAKGQSNPELQRKAVEYLGLFGGSQGQQALAEVYASSNDIDVRHAVLRSFMLSGDRNRLLAAAKSEKVPELRREAIKQLGLLGARAELWQLYQTETSVENKEEILQALFLAGDGERLHDLAVSEKNNELRLRAIRNLGLMGEAHAGGSLASLYAGAKDRESSKAVIEALFLQNNAHDLVAIARKETDPELKKNAVQRLSLMHSKEATDFLMELLNK